MTRYKQFLSTAVALALIAGPAAPGASRTPPLKKHPVPDNDSPVRCNADRMDGDGAIAVSAQRRGQTSPRYAPPPYPVMAPPPPPPPPPVVVGMPAPQPVTTGAISEARKIAPPGYPPPYTPPPTENRERYEGKDIASIKAVAQEPVSTFSVDVDTGSYANVRRFLTQGQLPPASAVRTEELINYFRYDYAAPKDRSKPFSLTTDMAVTPWNNDTRLLRIGIKGFDVPASERPAANLVFLVDVSGSMNSQDKLPLVKSALSMLADRLGSKDKVSIVVYAGAAGIVLDPTNKAGYIKQALDCLEAGGSTAGGQGMELAYATAKANFIKGGVNRVIMATDGDFNVGISSNDGIEAIVKKNREAGVTLTTLGFGQGNYNEAMMERVADVGNGNYSYIDSAIEAQKVLDEEMAATIFTIAKDVKIQIEFNPQAVKEYRLIGYENRLLAEEDFDNDKVDAGDIGSGHQVTALYEVVPTNAKGWMPDRRYAENRVLEPWGQASEMAWLKLRYKLPDGDTSMLIEQPVPVSWLRTAKAPTGDMAFVTAVAAYGQKLRGDKYLGDFGWTGVRSLAGDQRGYVREEFLKLVGLAASKSGS
ncbi:vWA domain-containing protein [Sphingorhabdus sp.]|jgi:Ca-activated chloride channel family protein|uniref:vWA domain-containing protein n=1 Tax=Sphingorhabdus sp. TaxID=1902408 RepID=UPI003BAFEC20